MDIIQHFTAEMQKNLAVVREIADTADAEGRGLTGEERTKADEALGAVAEFKAKITSEQEKAAMLGLVDGFENLNNPEANPVRTSARASAGPAQSIGEALVTSDFWQGLQAKARGGSIPRYTTPVFEVAWPLRRKSAGDPVLESGMTDLFGSGGAAGAISTLRGLETPGFVQYRLTVADLLNSVPITVGNSVTYPVVDTRTAISGTPQTEGQAKPGGEYKFTLESKTLITLAGWVKLSTQFLEDAPGLVAYVNNDLPLQIRQNEEAYLTTALYSGVDSVDGSGINGSNGYDAIIAAKTEIQIAGGDPNAVLIHPDDWAALLVTKLVAGDGGYVGGGPFAPTSNPWNLTPVITPSATAGFPLVGDFGRGATVYRRGGMSVTSTNSDGTDFQDNVITVRAEERLVVGVTYPEWFVGADIGTGS